jgi:hypothetical protein
MTRRYDVERMLNRLVESNEPDDDDFSTGYSWQKDKNYRDKKTENLSVDDLINSIGSPGSVRGKHEAESVRVRPVKSSEKDKHVVKQKIVYRTPVEVQQQVEKTEDIDSKTYLNNMLDRMEKELNMLENPLKPKVIRPKETSSVAESENISSHQVSGEEKSPVKLKTRKKYADTRPLEKPENIEEEKAVETSQTEPEIEEIKPEISENTVNDTENIDSYEHEHFVENVVEDEENLLDDFSAEEMKNISEEMSILTEETENSDYDEGDTDGTKQSGEKEKKGFFSRIFSKKEKKNKLIEPDEELIDFDEEEFNKKFDELNEQIGSLIEESGEQEYHKAQEDSEDQEWQEEDYHEDIEENTYSEPEQEYSENIYNEETYESEEPEINSDIIDENEVIEDDYVSEAEPEQETEIESDTVVDTETDDFIEDEVIDSNDDEELVIDNKLLDNDEESDKNSKNKKYTYYGFIIAILAIIGLISIVYVGVRVVYTTIFSSSIKTEATSIVYPLVAEDITPFNSIDECSDSEIIGASILNILMNEDTSAYGEENAESLLIPKVDVELSAKDLFGEDAKISEHSNVTIDGTTFYYDENGSDYIVTAKPFIYTSKPSVEKIINSGNTYKAQVVYVTDYPDWIENKDSNDYYTKICYYTLEKDENGKLYVVSVTNE